MARDYFKRSARLNPKYNEDPLSTTGVGLAFIMLRDGKRSEAENLLARTAAAKQKTIKAGDERFDSRYDLARMYAIRGTKDEAYSWLQKAIDLGWRDYRMAQVDPWFENVRSDERFRQMMANVKGMVDEMRRRVEEMEKT
jgi:TPR repeat protein